MIDRLSIRRYEIDYREPVAGREGPFALER
jgi:hypothetical protein